MYFEESVGHEMYSFPKQQNEQMMPESLQSHPRVCGVYTIGAAFHLFKFRQEEVTGVQNAFVLSFISKNM